MNTAARWSFAPTPYSTTRLRGRVLEVSAERATLALVGLGERRCEGEGEVLGVLRGLVGGWAWVDARILHDPKTQRAGGLCLVGAWAAAAPQSFEQTRAAIRAESGPELDALDVQGLIAGGEA